MSQQLVCDFFFYNVKWLSRLLVLVGTASFCGRAIACVMLQSFWLNSQTANRKHWFIFLPCHGLPSRVRDFGWSEAA